MNVYFKNCWVGTYVGSGNYEGGTCPDILITNVPEGEDIEELFDKYLEVLCDNSNQEKKEYDVSFSYSTTKRKKPIKLTKREELVDCIEESVQVDYEDLLDWYFNEEDEEISVDSQELVDFCNEDWSDDRSTLGDVYNICEDMIEDRQDTDDLETLHLYQVIFSYVDNTEYVKLKDKDDKNLDTYLRELVNNETIIKDVWSDVYNETGIYKFELNSKNDLIIRVNMTYDELKKVVEYYSKSSNKEVNPFDVDWN